MEIVAPAGDSVSFVCFCVFIRFSFSLTNSKQSDLSFRLFAAAFRCSPFVGHDTICATKDTMETERERVYCWCRCMCARIASQRRDPSLVYILIWQVTTASFFPIFFLFSWTTWSRSRRRMRNFEDLESGHRLSKYRYIDPDSSSSSFSTPFSFHLLMSGTIKRWWTR